jgi:chromosome segregation ATPase
MTLSGLEKFSHLEDKIHRTAELCRSLKAEKEQLEAELEKSRLLLAEGVVEKEQLRAQIEFLMTDRDSMKLKIEAMLDAITMLELEADSAKK